MGYSLWWRRGTIALNTKMQVIAHNSAHIESTMLRLRKTATHWPGVSPASLFTSVSFCRPPVQLPKDRELVRTRRFGGRQLGRDFQWPPGRVDDSFHRDARMNTCERQLPGHRVRSE